MDNKGLIKNLIEYPQEEMWLEFKESWFEFDGIGEYISALSNAAAIEGVNNGYLVWGVNDETHEIVGTTINYKKDVKNEPFEHYLARNITPDINFKFEEVDYDGKRVVLLTIPCAKKIPTAFKKIRYLRIGSSKVNLEKYPEREANLFYCLRREKPTLENQESYYQDLTFNKLMVYYASKGIVLKPETFKKNLKLLTEDGKYNMLAQLLSDNSHIPIRVSIFSGRKKSDPLYAVKEFGNDCLLISLDKVLDFGDTFNIPQADESNRKVERQEVELFNIDVYREAMINAFVHNKWIDGNAPMITIYSNRIEILSRGTLPPNQTVEGFFLGESVPVNETLSDIFLQLHISERAGRGVPKIIDTYGKDVYEFRQNSIVVNIPFKFINTTEDHTRITDDFSLNSTQRKIIKEIRNNPNITAKQLSKIIGVSQTTIQNNQSTLKRVKVIERVGSTKKGYWKVNDLR